MKGSGRLNACVLALGFGLGACVTTPPPPLDDPGAAPTTVFDQPGPVGVAATNTNPVLYARDGSIVVEGQSPSGAAAERLGPARRDLAPGDGGRMYLLELYQNVIEERDGLAREVTSLQADLEQARLARGAAQEEAEGLRQRLAEIEASNAALLAENLDLAARLTTAQIRRLQAEKLLLEQRIAAEREAREAREAAASTEVAEVEQP